MARQTESDERALIPSVSGKYEIDDLQDLDPNERRSWRALNQRMIVLPQADQNGECTGIYRVRSVSGETYTVDVTVDGRCTCPDQQHNEPENGCKHRRRVRWEFLKSGLPSPGDDVDPSRSQRLEAALREERPVSPMKSAQ